MNSNNNNELMYGVGIQALFSEKNNTIFSNVKEAIDKARSINQDFIVEFSTRGKRILSWNYSIEEKSVLQEKYISDGDKRSILAAYDDDQWLVLSKGRPCETILPLSKVKAFKKIDA